MALCSAFVTKTVLITHGYFSWCQTALPCSKEDWVGQEAKGEPSQDS